ncbi:MAG: thioredoxin [Propionibacterium sp.]|nr:thioredoxin [Propionibacterium sp.]
MATQEITKDNLDSTITGSDMVFLDFWADWCGPCHMFAPVFEKAAEQNTDVVFGKIDTEAQQELASGFGIMSIPTLMAFREGVLVFNQPGALNRQQLDEVIDAVRGLDMEEVHAEVAKQQAAKAADEG